MILFLQPPLFPMIGNISHLCFFLYLANPVVFWSPLVLKNLVQFTVKLQVHVPPHRPRSPTASCPFWLKTHRGGRVCGDFFLSSSYSSTFEYLWLVDWGLNLLLRHVPPHSTSVSGLVTPLMEALQNEEANSLVSSITGFHVDDVYFFFFSFVEV